MREMSVAILQSGCQDVHHAICDIAGITSDARISNLRELLEALHRQDRFSPLGY